MGSSQATPASTSSRWWKQNDGIAVCDTALATPGAQAATLRCPRHRVVLPCDQCALRDREANTAGWVIGLVGALVAALVALSIATDAGQPQAAGNVALALTLLLMAGAVAGGLLVAQLYGGERIGVEVACLGCGSRFVWQAADAEAQCPGCSARLTLRRGGLRHAP